jgi:DNA polymerase elongation subunit (family B)
MGYDHVTKNITDKKKWLKRLTELNINPSLKDWYSIYCDYVLPAHVQLANKMKTRGCPVDVGSRIEFVIVNNDNPKAKNFMKIEDPYYVQTYPHLLKLDFLYVLHLAINPIDQLLSIVFSKYNVLKTHYKYRFQKYIVLKDLEQLFYPKIILS